jgi:hypothetical protein
LRPLWKCGIREIDLRDTQISLGALMPFQGLERCIVSSTASPDDTLAILTQRGVEVVVRQ